MMTLKRSLLLLSLTACSFAQSRTVTLNWTASTSPGVTYNIYRASGACPATGAAKIGSVAAGIVTYVDSAVAVGTYCYYVTAASAGLESVPSGSATAVVLPVAPTGLTVTPSLASLRVNQTLQFVASGSTVPTWTLRPALGAISPTGFYRAPSSIKGNSQTVSVIASIPATGETSTATVTVRKR